MNSNYVIINSDFLNNLNPYIADINKKSVYSHYLSMGNKKSKKLGIDEYFKITSKVKYKFAYLYCPKCKTSGIFPYPFSSKAIDGFNYCGACGEPNISFRFKTGYSKIRGMIEIIKIFLPEQKLQSFLDINQQVCVRISSVMEVYLRDYYVGILNSKFVKSKLNLADKFLKECKNDFLNPVKTHERFKKELNIDFKQIIGDQNYEILKTISAYRNVIVHNNGICDSAFLNKNVGKYNLHENIIINTEDLDLFSQTLEECVNKLDVLYHKQILSDLYHDANSARHETISD